MAAFFFPSVPAVFASDYPLAESIERLTAAIQCSGSAQLTSATMDCEVTGDRVRLSRITPFFVARLKPHFFGSFRETERGVVLAGRFSMSEWDRLTTGFRLCFIALWTAVVTLATLLGQAWAWWAPFAGLGMLALNLGVLKLVRWSTRNDVPWLGDAISRALTTPEKWPQPPPEKIGQLRRKFLELAGQ